MEQVSSLTLKIFEAQTRLPNERRDVGCGMCVKTFQPRNGNHTVQRLRFLRQQVGERGTRPGGKRQKRAKGKDTFKEKDGTGRGAVGATHQPESFVLVLPSSLGSCAARLKVPTQWRRCVQQAGREVADSHKALDARCEAICSAAIQQQGQKSNNMAATCNSWVQTTHTNRVQTCAVGVTTALGLRPHPKPGMGLLLGLLLGRKGPLRFFREVKMGLRPFSRIGKVLLGCLTCIFA